MKNYEIRWKNQNNSSGKNIWEKELHGIVHSKKIIDLETSIHWNEFKQTIVYRNNVCLGKNGKKNIKKENITRSWHFRTQNFSSNLNNNDMWFYSGFFLLAM